MAQEAAIANLTAAVKELVAGQGALVAGQERLVAESMSLRDTVTEVAGQWRPQVDADMEDLHRQLGNMRMRLDALLSSPWLESREEQVFQGGSAPRGDLNYLANGANHGPTGRRDDSTSRGRILGPFANDSTPGKVTQVLDAFADVFVEPQGLPPPRSFDHSIPLVPGAQPVSRRPYRYNPAQKDEIEKQVSELLRQAVIQHSCSPFASLALLVQKKDGSWRMCVDYRHLNALTVKNRYPLPVINELLDELVGACFFTSLDLCAGYHQIRMNLYDEAKTAFKTHHGHFEYKVMSFGLTNAPATFQGTMNTILAPLLRRCVIVFIDDILIYNRTLEEHIDHPRQVFSLLQQHQLRVKRSKCSFAQPSIRYLGHVINAQGVANDEKNIAAVQNWPPPHNAKEVRGFLGLAGYYRKFVRHFAVISKLLTELLKKHALFLWTSETDHAFETLKTALVSAPVLALPNFTKTFILATDASDLGIGAVLTQEGHPLAFLSRALGLRSRGLSTYKKECLAILMAVDRWRPYLLQSEFIIRTDQWSLIHLDDQHLTTPWQQKALTKLMGLRYRIQYKKGAENRAANALSRRGGDSGECAAISAGVPVWLDQGRVWLGANSALQQEILKHSHESALGGNSGFHVTYNRIKRAFSWPGLKQDARSFVAACNISKQAKPEHVAQAYIDNVYKLHGLPEVLILDRDRIFTSQLWRELFRLAGTQLRRSTTYHPQTDGQTERVLYGHAPRHFGIGDTSVCRVPELESWLEEREVMLQLVRQHLDRARQRMKHQADKKRSERTFSIDDWVFLKLQPYVQTLVDNRANHKLAFRYFGPFQVQERIGEVAYKLQLPARNRVHPVFHVSLLRPASPPTEPVEATLPEDLAIFPLQVTEEILAHHTIQRGAASVQQVQVKWSELPPDLATWEDQAELRRRFPAAPAWGQAVSEGGGDVPSVSPRTTSPTESRAGLRIEPRRQRKPNTRYDSAHWEMGAWAT
ncbi:uncharacterized protein LOC112270762 [Brachypodium distachyon]|uniref:uncharacterized protein LOC112270762 n=1 Tax=Brachypodium distachyon TaxID=15368 RepID=UPI000D0CF993|nr:uncharacterized protein LOC112270762 [Brachypodium distachyon]|eukprot:XP_024314628.1 uncharacterized protein LOC112270762 [Brachypodium distachyon]